MTMRFKFYFIKLFSHLPIPADTRVYYKSLIGFKFKIIFIPSIIKINDNKLKSYLNFNYATSKETEN